MKARCNLTFNKFLYLIQSIFTKVLNVSQYHMSWSSECTCVDWHSNIYHGYPAARSRQPCGFVPRLWVGLHRQLRSTEEDQQPVKVSQNTHASVGRTMHAHLSVITLWQHATAALLHRVHKGWSGFTCRPRGGGRTGGVVYAFITQPWRRAFRLSELESAQCCENKESRQMKPHSTRNKHLKSIVLNA